MVHQRAGDRITSGRHQTSSFLLIVLIETHYTVTVCLSVVPLSVIGRIINRDDSVTW